MDFSRRITRIHDLVLNEVGEAELGVPVIQLKVELSRTYAAKTRLRTA